MPLQQYLDNAIPVIPVDEIVHTSEHPFCFDPKCPCHEDQQLIREIADHVTNGLLAPNEATDIVVGRMV